VRLDAEGIERLREHLAVLRRGDDDGLDDLAVLREFEDDRAPA
jgi:hypothetical protein